MQQFRETPTNPYPHGPSLDRRVRDGVHSELRTRLRRDARLVMVGHGLLLVVVAIAILGDGLGSAPAWWLASVGIATLLRSLWQCCAERVVLDRGRVVLGTRLLVSFQGAAWGLGAAWLAGAMQAEDQAVVLIGLAGIVASASNTLEGDPLSFRLFVATIYGPIVLGLVSGPDHHNLLMALLAGTYAIVVLVMHRRAHHALSENVLRGLLLEERHLVTAQEKAYFEGLLRGAPLAIAVVDAGKRVRIVNDRFQALFGYTSEELIGRDLSELLVPPALAAEHGRLDTDIRAGRAVTLDAVRLAKGGRPVTVRISASAVADANEPGTVLMYEDISEEREVQARLKEREARLSRLIDSNVVGVAFWKLAGQVTEANDEFLRISGWDRADLGGGSVNFRTTITTSQAELSAAKEAEFVGGLPVVPWEHDFLRKDGSITPVLLAIAPIDEARTEGVAVILDIAARREAELQLGRKTAVLEAQVGSSLDGILVVDPQGRAIISNHQMAEMWRLSPEVAGDPDDRRRLAAVLGQTSDPEAFLSKIEHLYAHRDETSRDEIPLKDGRTFDRYSAPVVGPGGEYFGRIWTFRDITPSKHAEQALREARALAERTAENRAMFLANMSHEIRTPMNAVLGMLELVLGSELTTEQRHYLALASDSAEALLGIINDVLDYSKIGAGRIDLEVITFDLRRVVQGTAALLAGRAVERGLELVVDVAAELPTLVRGDPARLRQVLTNLLGNAIKFTERGEVVLTVRPQALEGGSSGVTLSIRDTGIGMTPVQLGHLFEEFTQGDGSTSRRFGGTGLGLAISHRLVEMMKGRITVTSEFGRGSEFVVDLPLETAEAGPIAPSLGRDALAGRSILVVDDNAVNRHLLDRMLTAAGAEVTQADGAAAALRALRSVRARGPAPMLAILDGQMPDVDGFELARLIRTDPLLAQTPLLMLTSSGQRGDAARCRELGIPGYLTKPVAQADLLEAIGAILHGHDHAGVDGEVITRHALAEARESLRVLLAEDNPVNQEVAATMLRRRGHRVDLVANGREAVAAVGRGGYDVVLMDIQMPEMDGYEATARIRALPGGASIPIIALTAHAYGAERDHCLAAGMQGFVTKPFKAKDLFAGVEGLREPVAGERPSPIPVPAAAEHAPVVDLAGFRAQLRESGVESVFDGILDTFVESTPERMEALCGALEHGTPPEVAFGAHALKSSTAAIGARELAAFLAGLEKAAKEGAVADRPGAIAKVRAGFAAVLGEVREARAPVVR